MSFSKPQDIFSSNFAWLLNAMSWITTPSYFFRSNVIYLAQKGPIKFLKQSNVFFFKFCFFLNVIGSLQARNTAFGRDNLPEHFWKLIFSLAIILIIEFKKKTKSDTLSRLNFCVCVEWCNIFSKNLIDIFLSLLRWFFQISQIALWTISRKREASIYLKHRFIEK